MGKRTVRSSFSRTGTTPLNSYTESGNLLSMTEPGVRTTTFGYDAMGRRTLVDQPNTAIVGGTSNNITRTSYYPSGKIKAVWGDQTYATFRLYDGQNRMTGLRTYRGLAHGTEPTSATTGYDATQWLYHAGRGWLSGKRDAANKGADYTYTAAGRLKTRTWARGKHTRYDYRFGHLVATRYFTSSASDNGTNAGNDPASGDVGTTYNVFGQPLEVVTSSTATRPGTRILNYYATTTTLHRTMELLQVDPDLSFSLTAGSNGVTVNYGAVVPSISRFLHRKVDSLLRDTGADLRHTFLPSGTLDSGSGYEYHADHGRLARVYPTSDPTRDHTYSYVANSNLLWQTMSPAHTVTRSWDSTRDALTGIASTGGGSTYSGHTYTVNAIGQRTAVASATSGGSGAYGYNARGEVVNSTFPTSNFYAYDGIGNRERHRLNSSTDSGGTLTQYTATSLNQYSAIASPGVTINPSYDDDGNMISGPLPAAPSASSTLVWDGENRLVEVQVGSGGPLVKHVYDAYGRRVVKTVGSTNTYWCYDGWNPVARYGGAVHMSGSAPALTLHQVLLWGLDLSGTLQGAGGVGGLLSVNGDQFPLYDGNGNIVQTVHQMSGYSAVLPGDAYAYDPFGKLVVTGTTSSTFQDLTGYGFSTKPMDAETGLYYYGYRFYDSLTGRWPSRDPIGEMGGVNLYRIVFNSVIYGYDYLGGDWHHKVPFAQGLDAGLSPNFINGKDNGWNLSKSDHDALHAKGWLKDWKEWFKEKCKKGEPVTEDEVKKQAEKMSKDPKYKDILAKGSPAEGRYPNESSRMSDYNKTRGLRSSVVAGKVGGAALDLFDLAMESEQHSRELANELENLNIALKEGDDPFDAIVGIAAKLGEMGLDDEQQKMFCACALKKYDKKKK